MPLTDRDMKLLAARIALEGCDRWEIYSIADRLASDGVDDPNILEILVLGDQASLSEIQPFFRAYLESKCIEIPAAEEARLLIAYIYSKELINGVITPGEAAGKIWQHAVDHSDRPHKYDLEFVYLLDDQWDARSQLEAVRRFTKEAERLVQDFEIGNLDYWLSKSPQG